MAAPAPHWKRKTRPCPFYSQGRCLFSDACNFIHSVKVNNEPATRADLALADRPGLAHDVGDTMGNGMVDGGGVLRRRSSKKRRSVMSPPRSPRLSGLLSALEPVIGPDVEEFGEVDEEDEEDGEDEKTDAPHEPSEASSAPENSEESSLVDSAPDSPGASLSVTDADPGAQAPAISPFADSSNSSPPAALSLTDDNTGPTTSTPKRVPSFRTRAPSPIVTQHHDHNIIESTVLDKNTLELCTQHPHPHPHPHHHRHNPHHRVDEPISASRGSRPPSTFDLLSSPFPSPALRILSPQIFPTREPLSPIFGALQSISTPCTKPYSDDDLDSLETLESSTEESAAESSGSGSSQEAEPKASLGDSHDSIETSESSTEDMEDLGSPHETERPTSDYFRTPRNVPRIDDFTAAELEDLPRLSSSLTKNSNGTDKRLSQIVFPTSEGAGLPLPSLSLHREDNQDNADGVQLRSTSPPSHSASPLRSSLAGPSDSTDKVSLPDDCPASELEHLPTIIPTQPSNIDEVNMDSDNISMISESEESIPLPKHIVQGESKALSEVPLSKEDSEEDSTLVAVSQDEDSFDLSSYLSSESTIPSSKPLDQTDVSSGGDALTGHLLSNNSYQNVDEDEQKSFSIPPASVKPTVYLEPISTSHERHISLDSPLCQSLGPSPVSTDLHSSHTSDTLVELDTAADDGVLAHETILERRKTLSSGSPKRLSVVSLASPTKILRESHLPASLEKTIRATPSPLYEEPRPSGSPASSVSSANSSAFPSWADVSKKLGAAQRVPFGFRQSLIMERSQSSPLARSGPPYSARESMVSRSSSMFSRSPTFAQPRSASRLELLSGRARSVSPAPFAAGPSDHRGSVPLRTSSVSSSQRLSLPGQPRSASQMDFISRARSDSPVFLVGSEPSSSRPPSWMKPLRLSQVIHSPASSDSHFSPSLSHRKRFSTASIPSPASHVRNVSQGSFVNNNLLSPARSSLISAYLNDSNIPAHDNSPIIANDAPHIHSLDPVPSASPEQLVNDDTRQDRPTTAHRHSQSTDTDNSEGALNLDLLSPLSGSMRGLNFEELYRNQYLDSAFDTTSRELVHDAPSQTAAPVSSVPRPSALAPIPTPSHAIATPRPTLIFAIASDNPADVERVLASGEARPNDDVGPQSALEFALTNDALVNKTEIVKTLLAYGADPATLPADLRSAYKQHAQQHAETDDVPTDLASDRSSPARKGRKRESMLNPAMKYYMNRAAAASTSAVLRRSDFRPLARMRFDFVGQDRALEHLYWVLGMHSQQPIGTPLVVLCCGPSGHGKSLLARKFGSLLDVPTHTVNMTILKTSHDLWQCPSMSPYDQPSERTLAEFLTENAGKRCVVVLDEIDKNADERTLWSLLAPWELGRCSIDAGRRHIDVRNVIWLGTSNIGQDLVFEHHENRGNPETMMSKVEYRELMNLLRPRVTERLGTSLMSRVTAVLPFVPFTDEEKLAIASEALIALGGEVATGFSPDEFESLAAQCVSEYVATDGARSLYRSVSTHLMEAF